MMRNWRITGLVGLGLAAAASLAAFAPGLRAETPTGMSKAEAEGLIFERQQIMMQLDKDAEHLGNVVAGLAPRDQLGPAARAVANGARDAQASFAMTLPGGRSKPEVWSNRAEYDKLMQDFVTKSDAMARLGEAGNVNGVIEAMIEAMPCKQCHDRFREPRKSS